MDRGAVDSHHYPYSKGDRMEVSVAFGRAVKARRAELDMTQEVLANDAHLTPAFVSGIERGKRQAGLETVSKLATALGIKPSELWRRAEELIEQS